MDHVSEFRRRAGQHVELRFAQAVNAAEFAALPEVDKLEVRENTISCLLRGEPDGLLKVAARHKVVGWSAQDRELEDLFLDYYRVPNESENEQ